MRRPGSRPRERGVTLVFGALSLLALTGMAALAIDLSMLMDARAEAQRAADAAALAGADAFRDFPLADAPPYARDQALQLAAANEVRRRHISVANMVETPVTAPWGGTVYTVQTDDVLLNVIPDSQRVRVWVTTPPGITFFARVFGWGNAIVRAKAAAEAANGAPTVHCLKPFLLPDMWHESSPDEDSDGDGLMDGDLSDHFGGERWFYEPGEGDYYVRYGDTEASNPFTGYGTGRAGYEEDWGTPMLIKPQTGNAQRQGNSYFTLDGPESNLRNQIKSGCMDADIGDAPEQEQGGKTGQVGGPAGGITYLVNQDAGGHWDAGSNTVVGSSFGDKWLQDSPRVILIGLFDPIWLTQATDENDKLPPGVTYDNFARMWLEAVDGNDNIMARFLGFVPGGEGGPIPSTTVKRIRLIE
jgi:Putative Flp pilus-assembly TadE/G-like